MAPSKRDRMRCLVFMAGQEVSQGYRDVPACFPDSPEYFLGRDYGGIEEKEQDIYGQQETTTAAPG